MQYINVVVDNKSNHTDSFYTYRAPDNVGVGGCLLVPFARRRKPVLAYCVETDVSPSCDESKIKDILEYDEDRSLNKEMIDTALWMRQRYGIRYFDAVKLFTTSGKRMPKSVYVKSRGLTTCDYTLTQEQEYATGQIGSAIAQSKFKAFLIKGVTNSGKTEVYMKAVEEALAMGKTAIVLLPEIALSSQVEKRFKDRFGAELVATLHSRLTTSAKLREWIRLRTGHARIAVGPRTSVFAPLDNIGVIVIDEEHESTFKSDHNPKYETIDVAYKRAVSSGAALVLGSATPSVVSYYRARNGVYDLIHMDNRVGDSVMPELQIVDMCKEMKAGNTGLLSRQLAEDIDRTLARKEQVILFLNRRGYSTQILCPDCGYKMTCPDCGITLTYHKREDSGICHYCGRKFETVKLCPDCGSKFIKYAGAGTEKVEEAAREIWHGHSVARFDLDTAMSLEESAKVVDDFQEGRTDILVGTQILAKGLDFRNVGLVGIINADASLNIPDYRSSERTYQLITQVAGRAGRAGGRSKVVIQTYDPDSDTICDAANSDYEAFYESELKYRRNMNYPPFSDIISVAVVSDSEDEAMMIANLFRNRLLSVRNAPGGASVLPPRLEERRAEDRCRASFIIKAPSGSRSGYIGEYLEFRRRLDESTEFSGNCFIEVDVNPYSIT